MCVCVCVFSHRYMEQIQTLKFVRDTHIKKFNKVMKYDLPNELETLR